MRIRPTSLAVLLSWFVVALASGIGTQVSLLADEDASREQRQHFETHIGPLLSKHCAACHNASNPKGGLDLTSSKSALAGGESGPAIVKGNSSESLIVKRIADGEMPPEPRKPLTAAERRLLEDWIKSGAPWGDKDIDPFEFSSDARAGYDWWSLQPVRSPDVPVGKLDKSAAAGLQSAIDGFVVAKLVENGISPAEAAGPRELVRRVYLDVIGLPPSSDDVDKFVLDTRPDAYERLLDRALSSPHYGERWARHWLDIIRFGESQGFERDKLRTNAWRYRDWVVDALNQDVPYDQFSRLQLAGDAIQPGDPLATIATGFLVAGAYDEVGQQQQSAAMRAIVRQDELEDIVGAVSQTFLGLTANCGRCHDHKFDPISQREYYRLAAALAGVRHGERELSRDLMAEVGADAIASLKQRQKLVNSEIEAIERPLRDAILAERKRRAAVVPPPKPALRWTFSRDANDESGSVKGNLVGGATVTENRVLVDGKSHVTTGPIPIELKEKTLEVLVQLNDLDQRGGAAMSLQMVGGLTFDAIVFGEQEPGRWMAGSNGFVRSSSFQGPVEVDAATQPVLFAIAYHADGTIAAYRNGQPYGKAYRSVGLQVYPANQSQILFGLRHDPPGGNRFLKGAIVRAQLYDRALNEEEAAAAAGVVSDAISLDVLLKDVSSDQRARHEALRFEAEQIRSQIIRWNESKVYSVVSSAPVEPTFVLRRGQTTQRGEQVSAGGIQSVRLVSADWKLNVDSPDPDRRVALAKWIADRNNPLFGRVMANRVWQFHFGSGIVETANDFGFNGTRPSHPELLDWLASSLWYHDGSLKRLHREIMVSASYRQTSRNRPEAINIDAGNRLVWRRDPIRLDAEVIRDAMLAAAGELNTELHGPGFYDFTTFVRNTQFYEMKDPTGPTFTRRSLYRTWVRSGRSNFLDVFDCPDPSTKTPTRANTTTPLQSLALLNSGFSLRVSELFAAKLEAEHPGNRSKQIEAALRSIYGRKATTEEQTQLVRFADDFGLAGLCRVLFNSNEFLHAP